MSERYVCTMHPAEYVWCPTCERDEGWPCVTASGRRSQPHAPRQQRAERLHHPRHCYGQPCTLHHPSDHHMVGWPTTLRSDLSPPIYERICPHGVGHPDPDSVAWAKRDVAANPGRWQDDMDCDGEYVSVHGCDGCCRAESPRYEERSA